MADTRDDRRTDAPAAGRGRWWIAGALLALAFVLLTVVVAVRDGRPLPGDLALHDWSVAHRPHGMRTFAVAVTDSGNGVIPYLMALAAGLLAGRAMPGIAWVEWRRLEGVWAAAEALLLFLALRLVRYAVMEWVGRPRPPAVDWIGRPTGMSYPSGHTTTAAAAALLLICAALVALCGATRIAVVAVAAVWAVLVGLSRVYLGVHWPSDVLGGWLLVAAAGCALWALPRRRTRQDAQW
ncbi:phosphatase PAP2 family protein [Spirillospora sp. NPDC049652]